MFLAIPYFELKTVYLFGSTVPFWVFTLWVGRLFALLILLVEIRRLKLSKVTVLLTFFAVLILNQFFEKILFFISHSYLHNDGHLFSLFEWFRLGRVYFGSLIGTFLGVVLGVFLAKKWEKLGQYLDVFFLANIVALFFYRIGNVLAHSHIGKITDSPLGIEYFGSVRYEPSLYEAFFILFLFVIVWFLRKKIIFPGALALLIVSFLSFIRFLLDSLRNTDLASANFRFGNGLSLNQTVYFILFLFCGSWLLNLFKNHQREFFLNKARIINNESNGKKGDSQRNQ